MNKESAEEAVKRGIVWLDGVHPNWRELLDWELLDMASNTRCILGQVFAEDAKRAFSDGLCSAPSGFLYVEEILGIDINMTQFGFDAPCEPWHTFSQLQNAWIKLS